MRNFGDLQSRLGRMRQASLGGMFGPSQQKSSLVHVFFRFLGANMLLGMFIFGLSALIGAFAWPYAINEWLTFAGRPMCVEPWHGAIIGLVPGFGWASLPVAVITWIAMLFLGG